MPLRLWLIKCEQAPLHQPAALGLLQNRSLYQAWQCRDNRAINERDRLVDLAEAGISGRRRGLFTEFEHVKQDEQAVLIEVQFAVSRFVSTTLLVMEAFEQR